MKKLLLRWDNVQRLITQNMLKLKKENGLQYWPSSNMKIIKSFNKSDFLLHISTNFESHFLISTVGFNLVKIWIKQKKNNKIYQPIR